MGTAAASCVTTCFPETKVGGVSPCRCEGRGGGRASAGLTHTPPPLSQGRPGSGGPGNVTWYWLLRKIKRLEAWGYQGKTSESSTEFPWGAFASGRHSDQELTEQTLLPLGSWLTGRGKRCSRKVTGLRKSGVSFLTQLTRVTGAKLILGLPVPPGPWGPLPHPGHVLSPLSPGGG